MELQHVIESMLLDGRGLTSEDRECLAYLTPQGMAKLNCDLGPDGILLENTMAVLRRVFRASKEWRQRTMEMISAHPAMGRHLRQRGGEPLSTEELVFLLACHERGQLNKILKRISKLEECADEYFHDRFVEDAGQMQEIAGVAIQASQLAPTVCPPDLSTLHFLHPASFRRSRTLVMQRNPVVSWFQSKPNEKFLISCDKPHSAKDPEQQESPQKPRSPTKRVRFASALRVTCPSSPHPIKQAAMHTQKPLPNPLVSPKIKPGLTFDSIVQPVHLTMTASYPPPGLIPLSAPGPEPQPAKALTTENLPDSWSSFGPFSSEPSFIGSSGGDDENENCGQPPSPPSQLTASQKVRRMISAIASSFRARHPPPSQLRTAAGPKVPTTNNCQDELVAAAIGNRCVSKPALPSPASRPSRTRLFTAW